MGGGKGSMRESVRYAIRREAGDRIMALSDRGRE